MNIRLILGIGILSLFLSCAKETSSATTSNGLKYELFADGDGVKGNEGDYISFHISYLADENEQFNSREQGSPNTIQLGETGRGDIVTLAMNECLGKLSVGDSLALYVPTDSLRSLGFPPTDTTKLLTYRIRVVDIEGDAAFQERSQAERAEFETKAAVVRERLPEVEKFVGDTYRYIVSGKGGDNIKSTPSGIQYIIHEEGTGEQLQAGEIATVHYYGILKSNGNEFDNSFKKGTPFSFPLGGGRVIQGWDEGVQLFKKGTKGTLIIPYQLGYGEGGNPPRIPERSDLIFYIEVAE